MRRALRIGVGLLFVVVAAAACSSSFGMARGSSEQGAETFRLWQVFFWAGIFVAGVVYGLIVWSLIRFRRRRTDTDDAMGRPFSKHIPIEIAYTAIPVLMVIALFGFSLRTGERIGTIAADPDVTLHVEGFMWGWRFTYPDDGVAVVSDPSGPGVAGPTIHLPLGETVQVELTSNDVIHAFWVPDFLFKRDATPGHPQIFDITPSELGTFHGVCSEFCGLNHSFMTFTVEVVSPEDYRAWIASGGKQP